MSMIKIENLTFSYPTSYDNIFENVSIQIDTEWKLGFVGRNGRGKTTLLNILLSPLIFILLHIQEKFIHLCDLIIFHTL